MCFFKPDRFPDNSLPQSSFKQSAGATKRLALSVLVLLMAYSASDADVTAVSNTDQPLDAKLPVVNLAFASAFTTGNAASTLTSVTLKAVSTSPTGGASGLLLRANASGVPGALIENLGVQSIPAGASTPIFLSSGTPLSPNTTYWLTLGEAGSSSGNFQWDVTASTAETSTLGWAIADQTLLSNNGGLTWQAVDFGPPNESAQFAVNVTDVTEPSNSLGTTTVDSIGHVFVPQSDEFFGGNVYDLLVNGSQIPRGGGVVPSVVVDLDTMTSYSYTIQAPDGFYFHVEFPNNAIGPAYIGELNWLAPSLPCGSSTNFGTLTETIVRLEGGPLVTSINNHVSVACSGRVMQMDSGLNQEAIAQGIDFTSLTLEATYTPDPFGNGEVLYEPFATTLIPMAGDPEGLGAFLFFVYKAPAAVTEDPGSFVSILPIPGILLGDVNLDGFVNLLDVSPFVSLLSSSGFQEEADINQDKVVNLLDITPFVNLLGNGN